VQRSTGRIFIHDAHRKPAASHKAAAVSVASNASSSRPLRDVVLNALDDASYREPAAAFRHYLHRTQYGPSQQTKPPSRIRVKTCLMLD
jgi:histidine ammonia-lyase